MGQADVNVNLWLKDTNGSQTCSMPFISWGNRDPAGEPSPARRQPQSVFRTLRKNVVKKQYRDIIMNWQDQAVLMLLAVKSQTAIHYAAPLKVMLYDSMEYAEQVWVKWKERPPRLSSAEFLSRFQKE